MHFKGIFIMTIVDALKVMIAQLPDDSDRESCLSLHTDWIAFEGTETADDSLCTVLEGLLLQSVLLNTIIRSTVNHSHKIQCQFLLDGLREVFAEIENSLSAGSELPVTDPDPVDKAILSRKIDHVIPSQTPPSSSFFVFNPTSPTIEPPLHTEQTTFPTAIATPAIPTVVQTLSERVTRLEEHFNRVACLEENFDGLIERTLEPTSASMPNTEKPAEEKDSFPFLPNESTDFPSSPPHLVGFGTYVINQICTFQNCTFNVFGAPPAASSPPPL